MNAVARAAALAAALAAAAPAECETSANYFSAAGALALPQGGARMHRAGGAVVRAGRYFSDVFAVELEAGRLELATALGARGIWHAQGWDWFGMLFGYERLDPFLSFGARGWGPDGDIGPSCGVGAFYYLGDTWAVRADAGLFIGTRSSSETAFSLTLGLQYSF